MKGKYIVITGASGGLGASIAYECAKQGGNVVLLARNKEKLQAIQQDLHEKYKIKVQIYSVDVTNINEVENIFSLIRQELPAIDVLVNNAGYGVFDDADEAQFEDIKGMFDLNVLGLISCTKQVLPLMKQRRGGQIINIASQAGKLATPKSSAYAATKHAVLGYTNALRLELKPFDVKVMAVNPGPIATNFFDVADRNGNYLKSVEKWMLKPEVVAGKIVYYMFTNKREINLPNWMNVISKVYTIMPSVVEKLGGKSFYQK
ncbi:SDR family NAD(P)-dependent oxidoreductase [Bacillus sp. 2205SS5-2]|uniref:SDR family NAD(P)-dependent oxidoreductase n=1 Tax=Bacillus sp. 2205SS5-2 TaxID=3109031 RepID=UPI003004BA3A